EFLKPREVIEDRMVDTIIASGSNIGRGHAQVLQEDCVVRSTAEIADRSIGAKLCRGRLVATGQRFLRANRFGCCQLARLFPNVVNGSSLRRGYSLGDVADELLQARHARGTELRAGNRYVHIEIRDRTGEFFGMVLSPLGGTDQTLFFRIPASD